MAAIEVKVPDIGDFKDVPVIELLVKPGDAVKKEDSLVTLESDKATMEVPSPADGVVKAWKVKVGDKVSEGSVVLLLDAADAPAARPAGKAAAAPAPAAQPAPPARPQRPHRPRRPHPPPGLSRSRRPRRRVTRRSPPSRRSRPRPPPTRAPACAASRASWASTSRR